MYSDPHVLVKIELTSNPNSSMGTTYAQAEVSELVIFGKALDGADSEHTEKHVERSYQDTLEALARALRDAEQRVNEQLGRLHAAGIERVGEREAERHAPSS